MRVGGKRRSRKFHLRNDVEMRLTQQDRRFIVVKHRRSVRVRGVRVVASKLAIRVRSKTYVIKLQGSADLCWRKI